MPTLNDRIALYRFIFVVLVFGAAATILLGGEEWTLTPTVFALLFPVAAETLLSLGYMASILRWPGLRTNRVFLGAQYVLDAAILAVPIGFTDGISSPFVSLYVLLVVVASLSHSVRFAVTLGLLSSALLAAITYLQYAGLLPGVPPPATEEVVGQLLVKDLVLMGLLLVVGVLPGRIVERLRRTDMALRLARRDYATVRELYRVVVEQVPSGLGLLDRGGRLVLLNRSGNRILRHLGESSAVSFLRWLLDLLEVGQDEVVLDRDGDQRMLGFAAMELDPEAAIGGTLILFQDITQRKRLERELEEQRRLGAIGQLSANLAHELRNPLAAISSTMQVLRTSDHINEEEHRLLAIQEREIERLERLVADFLQYARPDRVAKTRVDVRDVLRQVVDRVTRYPDVVERRVRMHLPDAPVFLETDPELLSQAMGNLLLNALQWSPEDEPPVIELMVEGERVVLRVADRGPGVSKEDLSRIFDPFYSRRSGGTGLGLAITWSAIQSLGGQIRLTESGPDGSLFEVTFELPEESGLEAYGQG